jgi:hypothetical protein
MNQTMKSPLVTHMSDDIREIIGSNIDRQKAGMTAYAVGNIFKGIELDAGTDLNTVTQACLRRVDRTVKNGPPIMDPTGYLHVITKYHGVNQESSVEYRIRQIIYPDSTNDPTPYTRVGYGAAGGAITWSIWNTLGGNMIRKILDHNIVSINSNASDRYALPNTMYESFGNYTLQLPDPNDYGLGTRIGLEQWAGTGQVTFVSGGDTYTQNTGADIDIDGNYIGAIIYLFEVVDAEVSTIANPVYEWKMDTLQNYDGVIAALEAEIAEHRLADQGNLYNYITDSKSKNYVVPQVGYIETTTANAVKVNGTQQSSRLVYVRPGDVITLGTGAVSGNNTIIFSPDEHAMYLRDDELNRSWHDKSDSARYAPAGRFSTSIHLKTAPETPASTQALLDLTDYVDVRDNYVIGLLDAHKTAADPHTQYLKESDLVDTYHTSQSKETANSAKAVFDLASKIQSRGLLYGAIASGSVNANNMTTLGIYTITGFSYNGPTNDIGAGTLAVIPTGTSTASTTTQSTEGSSSIMQIYVSTSGTNNMWYRTRSGTSWGSWASVRKSRFTIDVTENRTSTTVLADLRYCEPTYKCKNKSAITVTLPDAATAGRGARVNIESHETGNVTISDGTNTYTFTKGNGTNPIMVPVESDGSSWYMICVG